MGNNCIDVSISLNDNATRKREKSSSTFTKVIGSSSAIAGAIVLNKVTPKYIKKIEKDFYKTTEDFKNYDVNHGQHFKVKMQNVFDASGLNKKWCSIKDYSIGFPSGAFNEIYGKTNEQFTTIEQLTEFAKKNPKKWQGILTEAEDYFKDVEKYGTTDKEYLKFLKLKENKPKKAKKIEKRSQKILEEYLKDIQNFGTTNIKFIKNQKEKLKYPKLYKLQKILSSIQLKQFLCTLESIKTGTNAYTTPKTVHINMKDYSFLLPHELGHLKNRNNGGFGKLAFLLRSKIPTLLKTRFVPIILLTAILRDKKPEGEESSTLVGKSLDFIKDNCVGLTALLETPTIFEEGLASVRGLKMSKNQVTKQEFSMLKNLYKCAWKTYGFAALVSIGTVFVANSIKNLISGPKENPV